MTTKVRDLLYKVKNITIKIKNFFAKNPRNLLILIFILALLIRTYRLNIYPLGFHVDEAKVAWESLSILKTGRDDHGNLLSLHYNSFGDYRPTGIFYATLLPLFILGQNVFAVRFASAFFGSLTIFPIYFLTLAIAKKEKKVAASDRKLAAIAALLLAIIPWHIATSRATSEVVISCFLILTSVVLLTKKPRLSFVFLLLSLFFYHSARVIGPVISLSFIIYFWENIVKLHFQRKVVFGFLLTSLIAAILLISPAGRGRYNQVKLASPDVRNITLQYLSYFNPNFFLDDIAKPYRYTTENVGIVSIPIFLSFLLGAYTLIKNNKGKILLLLFAIGPIPASLTLEDSPNLHRSFFMLPFLIIVAAIGLNWLLEKHKNTAKLFAFMILITFITFIVNYFDRASNFAFQFRDPQTRILSQYISDNAKNYDRVYVTNDPDSPYPWYAFFNHIDPKKLNSALEKEINGKWQYENIIWDVTRCPAAKAFDEALTDKTLNKIMVVDNGVCFTDFNRVHSSAKIIREFKYNGQVNYRVWEYEPTR